MAAAADGGGYFVGYARAEVIGSTYDATILKRSADGAVVWHKRWGDGGTSDILRRAVARKDGGVWAIGRSSSFGSKSGPDGIALHVDKAGVIKPVWLPGAYKNGQSAEYLSSGCSDGNNGVLVAGRFYDGGTSYDPWLGRVDASGKALKPHYLVIDGPQTVADIALEPGKGRVV